MKTLDSFTEHEAEDIEQRLDNLNLDPSKWNWVGRRHYNDYTFQIELDPVTEFTIPATVAPDWVWEYESDSHWWPEVIYCRTYGEAMMVIDRVEQRQEPLDTAKIAEAIALVSREGLVNLVYRYLDEYTDDLPAEADEVPSWLEGNWNDGWCATTVGHTTSYYLTSHIPQPEDESAILFRSFNTQMEEEEINIAYAMRNVEIEEDSIESLVVRQHLCMGDGGLKADMAYEIWPLMIGCWLNAVPENLGLLRDAVKTNDFKRYYDDEDRAVEIWLHAAREADPDMYDEYMEELRIEEPGPWTWIISHE